MYSLAELKAQYKAHGEEEILNIIISDPSYIYACGILDDFPFFSKVLQGCEYSEQYAEKRICSLAHRELIEEVVSILYNMYMKKNEDRAKEPLFLACKLLKACTYPSGFFDDMKDDFKHWEYLSVAYEIEAYSYRSRRKVENTSLEEITRQSLCRFDQGNINQKLYIIRFWSCILEKYMNAIESYYYQTNYFGCEYRNLSPSYDNLSSFITATTLTILPVLFNKFYQSATASSEIRIWLYSLTFSLKQLGCERFVSEMNPTFFVNDLQLLYEKWNKDCAQYSNGAIVLIRKFIDIQSDEPTVLLKFIKGALFDQVTSTMLKAGELTLSDEFFWNMTKPYSKLRFAVVDFLKENEFVRELLVKDISNSSWSLMFVKSVEGYGERFKWEECLTSDDDMSRALCLEMIKLEKLREIPQLEEILVTSLNLAEKECNMLLSLATLEKCIQLKENLSSKSQLSDHISTHLERMIQQVDEYSEKFREKCELSELISLLEAKWCIFDIISLDEMPFLAEYLIGMIPNIPLEEFNSGVGDYVQLLLERKKNIDFSLFVRIINKILLELSDISLIEGVVPTFLEAFQEGIESTCGYERGYSMVCLVRLSSMVPKTSTLYYTIFDTVSSLSCFFNAQEYRDIRPHLSQAFLKANNEIRNIVVEWIILNEERNSFGRVSPFENEVNVELSLYFLGNDTLHSNFHMDFRSTHFRKWELLTIETIKKVYALNDYVIAKECDYQSGKDWEMLKPMNEAVIESSMGILIEKGRKLSLMKTYTANGVSYKILDNGWQKMDRFSLDLAKWFDEIKDDQDFIDISSRLPQELKEKLKELTL